MGILGLILSAEESMKIFAIVNGEQKTGFLSRLGQNGRNGCVNMFLMSGDGGDENMCCDDCVGHF